MAQDLHILFQKYLQQTLSAEEMEILFNAFRDGSFTPETIPDNLFAGEPFFNSDTEVNKDLAYEKLLLQLQHPATAENTPPAPVIRPVFRRRWFRAAAAILLFLSAGLYWWFRPASSPEIVRVPDQRSIEISPGQNGAILVLADGREVVLDSLGNGLVAVQHGAAVVLKNGRLSYDRTETNHGEPVYNIMRTPNGRQFQIRLPDGSRVWLNAASSLRFPTVFSGNQRRVEISGEAYFEVEPDASKPFIVNINNKAELEVLGTSFNVNAYDNENSIRSALVEGRVRLKSDTGKAGAGITLKPGELAILTANSDIQVGKADIDKILAWKNGAFNFNGSSLEEIMRQLERWYDIKVVYEKGVPDIRLGGELSRDVSLGDLLKGLKESELHFRMEDHRTLVILP